ncbi:endodeoxyribonuclease [Tilletia horrida]|uniref:DNA topoisomerase (ATP-hydrolyzing) n=1 Tax=Tilletia horrida TaxID=155126 RepID=A0AAN6GNL7_9BASI|nr:endodeoxyribonuclease [Tilletia horrida]KAK0565378.1 endodeoxyribonuclease [Tilletia horrida]
MKEAYINAGEESFITKRDLFYRDVELFGRQAQSDQHVSALCNALGVEREALGFRATAKGLVSGTFSIRLRDTMHVPEDRDSHMQRCIQGTSSTEHLIPFATDIESFESDAAWILIVEKDAIFSILRHARFAEGAAHELKPGLIITGKGYPDQGTQQLLAFIAAHPAMQSVPFFLLSDNDPFGIDILRVYRFGNGTSQQPGTYALPNLTWLGLRHDQHSGEAFSPTISEGDANVAGKLPLNNHDRKKATALLSKEWLPQEWKLELRHMLARNCKAEIEILLEQGTDIGRPEPGSQSTESAENVRFEELAAQNGEQEPAMGQFCATAAMGQPLLNFLAAQMKGLHPALLRGEALRADQTSEQTSSHIQ